MKTLALLALAAGYAAAQPFDLVALVDRSYPAPMGHLQHLARAIEPADRGAVAILDREFRVVQPLARDDAAFEQALLEGSRPARVRHLPRIYDALERAAQLFDSSQRSKVILLITCNLERRSLARTAALTTLFRKRGIRLELVVLPYGGRPKQPPYPPVVIHDPGQGPLVPRTSTSGDRHSADDIARDTGGRIRRVEAHRPVDWRRIAEELRAADVRAAGDHEP